MEKEKEKVYEENDNKSFLEKRGKKEGEGGGEEEDNWRTGGKI